MAQMAHAEERRVSSQEFNLLAKEADVGKHSYSAQSITRGEVVCPGEDHYKFKYLSLMSLYDSGWLDCDLQWRGHEACTATTPRDVGGSAIVYHNCK